jgi:hypothetical protein
MLKLAARLFIVLKNDVEEEIFNFFGLLGLSNSR